jgi:hypothetical protein
VALNSALLSLGWLQATSHVIQSAVHEIDGGLVGGTLSMPLQSQPVFDAACAATASTAPAQLQQRLVERLALVDAYALIAELRAYTNPPREVRAAAQPFTAARGQPTPSPQLVPRVHTRAANHR